MFEVVSYDLLHRYVIFPQITGKTISSILWVTADFIVITGQSQYGPLLGILPLSHLFHTLEL